MNKTPLFSMIIIGAAACHSTKEPAVTSKTLSKAKVSTAAETEIGYPKGDWWTLTDMNSLLLSGEHILVSHRDTKPVMNMASGIPASRTREEAKSKALALYSELREHPERFHSIAQRDSDDPAARKAGGSLGVFYATRVPEEIADALGSIKTGEVSRPVETPQGFHLLRRLEPQPEAEVTLAHIVIKYDQAEGWKRQDRPIPTRTIAQAREIGERLSVRAKQHPEQFGRMAIEYSESEDALREGDMGTLSTYDAMAQDFTVLTTAVRLPVGAVSDAIVTSSGVQIVLRKPLVSTKQPMAASLIVVSYKESQLSNLLSVLGAPSKAERTKQDAEKLASRLAAKLRKQPHQFDKLRSANCDTAMCSLVNSWYANQNMAVIEREVVKLKPKEVSPEAIDSPVGYVILRREDSTKHLPPEQPAPHFSFMPIKKVGEQPKQSS